MTERVALVAMAAIGAVAILGCRNEQSRDVARGEEIFFGRGKCASCHAVAGRGSGVRGPALDGIGAKAAEREPGDPGAFLVRSLVDPMADVAEGFAPIMPDVSRAPIALEPDAIEAVVRYLLSLGGDPRSLAALPDETRGPERVMSVEPEFARGGDVTRGREIFRDLVGPARCVACHGLEPGGSEIGPDLRDIAAIQPPDYIRAAVLEPNREIVTGYHQTIVVTTDERVLIGIVRNEAPDGFDLVVRTTAVDTETLRIGADEVAERAPGQLSIMPNNYSDLLSPEELRDLFAFLLSLRGE